MAGFTALYVECYMFTLIKDWAQIESGTGIVISFLSLIAIAGISGVLPPILYHGKLKQRIITIHFTGSFGIRFSSPKHQ
jgi:hypothetical protein